MSIKTFKAKVYDPVFYSSTEGYQIQTNARISATALMHAIGYNYISEFEKRYVLVGDEATTPDYSHLNSLPFMSDMEPVDVTVDEYTFRTVNYPEHSIVTTEDNIGKNLFNSSVGFPYIKGVSKTSWHPMRKYVGISPQSTYRFTVWDFDDVLPDELRFKVGIKQTGFIHAERVENSDKVTLNKFLLEELFDCTPDEISKLIIDCDSYERKNDPRLHHLVGVPIKEATELIKSNQG